MGQQGHASKFPCLFCRLPLGSIRTPWLCKGETFQLRCDEDFCQQGFSINKSPVWSFPVQNICPPILHIYLGLVKDIFHAMENECQRVDLRDFGFMDDKNVKRMKELSSEFVSLNNELKCCRDYRLLLEKVHDAKE